MTAPIEFSVRLPVAAAIFIVFLSRVWAVASAERRARGCKEEGDLRNLVKVTFERPCSSKYREMLQYSVRILN